MPELIDVDPAEDAHPDFVVQAQQCIADVQNTRWFRRQKERTQNIIQFAATVLNANNITQEVVKEIVKTVVLLIVECTVLAEEAYKAYAKGEYAPFSHDFALVKQWVNDAQKMRNDIETLFLEIESHLRAMADEQNFQAGSGHWVQYKTKVALIELKIDGFINIIDRCARPQFDDLKRSFENRYRDNQSQVYEQACKKTRLAWTKFFLTGEVFGSIVTSGLWQGGYISGKYCAAAAGVGSVAFAGWIFCRYHEDVDLSTDLEKLQKELRYLESYIGQYRDKLPRLKLSVQELVAEFRRSVQVIDDSV